MILLSQPAFSDFKIKKFTWIKKSFLFKIIEYIIKE